MFWFYTTQWNPCQTKALNHKNTPNYTITNNNQPSLHFILYKKKDQKFKCCHHLPVKPWKMKVVKGQCWFGPFTVRKNMKNILQNILFWRKRKVLNNMRSNWWQNLHFRVNKSCNARSFFEMIQYTDILDQI